MAKPKMTKKLAEMIHDITQAGAAVPSGYVFNPYHDPPLYKKSDAPESSEMTTSGPPEIVEDPANQPLDSSEVGDGQE